MKMEIHHTILMGCSKSSFKRDYPSNKDLHKAKEKIENKQQTVNFKEIAKKKKKQINLYKLSRMKKITKLLNSSEQK